MKIKERRDFYLAVLSFLAILSIVDIFYVHYQLLHLNLNGIEFISTGVMEYKDEAANKIIYLQIYEKVTK